MQNIYHAFRAAVFAVLLSFGFLLTACASVPAAPSGGSSAPVSKIIAVGDIHGDYDAYIWILTDAGLVDAAGDWAGGQAVFVQTGDIPDRGPDTRKIIDHIRKLETQAKAAGGRVVPLIGNHEVMNVTGDLRYVHPGEFAAFADDASASLEARIEAGKPAHKRAWDVRRDIGKWVAANDAIAIIDGNIFVHGGISREYSTYSIADMNKEVRAALKRGEQSLESIIHDPLGPMWYRGLIGFSAAAGPREVEMDARDEVDLILETYGAKRIIVGHTPSLTGIKTNGEGKLFRIDSGASAHYGGTRSFLRIENGIAFAHNDGKITKPD